MGHEWPKTEKAAHQLRRIERGSRRRRRFRDRDRGAIPRLRATRSAPRRGPGARRRDRSGAGRIGRARDADFGTAWAAPAP